MKTYLIVYGADNDMFTCFANTKQEAISLFAHAEVAGPEEETDPDDVINRVYECVEV